MEIIIPAKAMSVNKCWKGRKFKTGEYKLWREEIGWYLKKYLNSYIQWCTIEMNFYIKHFKTTDVDNLIKSLLDALVDANILDDDRYVISITATKHPLQKEEKERIELKIHEKAY